MRIHAPSRFLTGALALAFAAGCNEHPVQPLDDVVTGVQSDQHSLPAKTKIDFLFLVDNSGSMCEEQENLTRNFQLFSDFLFEDLGQSADYRIAVISTDMHAPNGQMGRFLNEPAPPVAALNCLDDNGEPRAPNTQDCQELVANGDLPLVIQSGRDGNIGQNCNGVDDPVQCAKEDLETKFRCLATLGTGGDGFEKGLEAMRLSLSCTGNQACGQDADCPISGRCVNGLCAGPNRSLFEACCKEDGNYDPVCIPPEGQEPTFLRPDAVLVVILITDEDDCSDPATNPPASNRAICKYGARDADADGVPDGYRDQNICGDRSPGECFQAECGAVPAGMGAQEWAEQCQANRCVISRSENSNCEWFRNELVPVRDYERFLTGLKAQPADQLLVAAVVGHRDFTSQGAVITYNPGLPQDEACLSSHPDFDPDVCCADGNCKGPIQPSCQSAGNGLAFAGRRYLELTELVSPTDPIGCPAGADINNPNECVHICVEDFSTPLQRIKESVAGIVSSYCLDKTPACQVSARLDDNGDVVPARSCEGAEREDPDNYPIRVRLRCVRTADEAGDCPVAIDQVIPRCTPDTDGDDCWELIINEPGCTGNTLVKLKSPPPAGSEVFVEFVVDVSGGAARAADDGGVGAVDGGAELAGN